MTDTPLAPPSYPPPSRLDLVKSFIGDLARPFAIISTSAAASVSSVIVATKVESGEGGALLMAAIFGGVGSLYIGKAWEVTKAGKHTADVEIAKAQTGTTT